MAASSRTNPTPQQKAAQETKPPFFVINDVLYYQTKSGEELKFDLDFPSSVMDTLLADDADYSDREQFFLTIEAMTGGKALLAKVKKMGALEQSRLMNTFLKQFEIAAGATLGESDGSSDS